MIRIIINNHLIRRPIPVRHVIVIGRKHAEVKTVEPEALAVAALDAPDVALSEASCEAAVLKRLVDVVSGVVGSCVVPDPFVVLLDVRRCRMSGLIGKRTLCRGRRLRSALRSMLRRSLGFNRSAGHAQGCAHRQPRVSFPRRKRSEKISTALRTEQSASSSSGSPTSYYTKAQRSLSRAATRFARVHRERLSLIPWTRAARISFSLSNRNSVLRRLSTSTPTSSCPRSATSGFGESMNC